MSKIEWTDASWNPIRARHKRTGKIGWHCEKVSPACSHCYAERQNVIGWAGGTKLPYAPSSRDDVEIFLDEEVINRPLKWRRPRRIFVCSMTDLFGEWVEQEWIERIFGLISLCGQHTFQVLTKRADRMRRFFDEATLSTCQAAYAARCTINDERTAVRKLNRIRDSSAINGTRGERVGEGNYWPLPNVWIGVTVADQQRADERVPHLLSTPAAVRFVSCEPLLGAIDLSVWMPCHRGDPWKCFANAGDPGQQCCECSLHRASIDWVIAGGESGPHARPMHPQWARDLRDQCGAAGVPFFFKQWGEWIPDGQQDHAPEGFTADMAIAEHQGEAHGCFRVGKKLAGRLLDGQEWMQFPDVTPRAVGPRLGA